MRRSDYKNLSTHDIFLSLIDSSILDLDRTTSLTPAAQWCTAEMIMSIRRKCQDWIDLMKTNDLSSKHPDMTNKNWTMSRAKNLVRVLDEDFDVEKGRWASIGVDAGPEFSRLTGGALLAFAQEIGSLLRTDDQLEIEARTRTYDKHEIIPPQIYKDNLYAWGYCNSLCTTATPPLKCRNSKIPNHGNHTKKPDDYFVKRTTKNQDIEFFD